MMRVKINDLLMWGMDQDQSFLLVPAMIFIVGVAICYYGLTQKFSGRIRIVLLKRTLMFGLGEALLVSGLLGLVLWGLQKLKISGASF